MLLLYSPYGLVLHALSRPSSTKVITPKREAGTAERKELPKANPGASPVYRYVFMIYVFKNAERITNYN